MQAIYGENNNYFNVDDNGNVRLTSDGINSLMELAVEDPNSPLSHSLLGMAKVIMINAHRE